MGMASRYRFLVGLVAFAPKGVGNGGMVGQGQCSYLSTEGKLKIMKSVEK